MSLTAHFIISLLLQFFLTHHSIASRYSVDFSINGHFSSELAICICFTFISTAYSLHKAFYLLSALPVCFTNRKITHLHYFTLLTEKLWNSIYSFHPSSHDLNHLKEGECSVLNGLTFIRKLLPQSLGRRNWYGYSYYFPSFLASVLDKLRNK